MHAHLKQGRLTETFKRGSLPHGPFVFVLVFALLAWSYGPLMLLYAREHWTASNLEGAYAHAPLLLALIGLYLWRQRRALSRFQPSPLPLKGLFLLLVGAAAKVYGEYEGYVVLQGMSLVPMLAGIVLLMNGEAAWQAVRFPVLMLLFVIPLPNAAIDSITRPLSTMTANMVVPLLSLFDIEVWREGNLLTVSARGGLQHEVLLAPECSGIRSLVALMAISAILANLRRHGVGRTLFLLLATPLIACLGNVLRVLVTILLIVYIDPATAQSFFHSASGVILFIFALGSLILLDIFADRRWRRGRK